MARALVTGGAGYIGSHTCVTLLEAGWDVVAVDNLSNSSAVAIERVRELAPSGHLEFVEGDLLDADVVERCSSTTRTTSRRRSSCSRP
jgi:UDP-glucose 4-epimerase